MVYQMWNTLAIVFKYLLLLFSFQYESHLYVYYIADSVYDMFLSLG
jgi:hypothetical protein